MDEQLTVEATPGMALVIPEPATAPRASLREMMVVLNEAGLVDRYAKDLVDREVAANLYDEDGRVARVFARSGYFGDINGATPDQAIAQAMTKVQLGRSWHMQPADAMQHIFFVNGRPAVQNEYLASQMRNAGLDWKIQWHRDADGACIGCTLWPLRLNAQGSYVPIMEVEVKDGKPIDVPASVSFKKVDAERVKVKEGNSWIALSDKATYKSFAEDMYFWRCIARLRRRYATNVLSGLMTKDEVEELPVVEIQKTLPAPRVMEVPAEDMRPARAARQRQGAQEIPRTAAPVAPPEPEPEPAPVAAAAPIIQTSMMPPAAFVTAPANTDQKVNLIAQIKAIGISRGDTVFVQQLFSISPRITPEALDTFEPGQLRSILNHLERIGEPQTAGAGPKRLF